MAIQDDIKRFTLEINESSKNGDTLAGLTKLEKETAALRQENESLEKVMGYLAATGKKNTDEYKRMAEQLKTNKKEISENGVAMKGLQKNLDLNYMSMGQLRKRAMELRSTLSATSKAANPEEYARLEKELKGVGDAMTKLKSGGSNAGGILGKLETGAGKLPGIFGSTAKGIMQMTRAAMAFLATPVGMILGVIAAVGMGAKALIKNSLEFGKAASSLSAITGATGKDLEYLKQQAREISKESAQSATDMLGAFEKIGSDLPALLANGPLLAEVTKNAVVLSEASGGTLAVTDAAKAAAGAMNQFNIPLTESARAINVLAAGSLVGSANIMDLNDSMKNSGAVLDGANLSLEQSVALYEVLATKQLKGAEAGTALRAVTMKLQAAGLGYASGQFNMRDALEEANKKLAEQGTAMEKDAYAQKVFGQEGITAGKILLNNVGMYDKLTAAVTGTNTAYDQQKVQNDNLATSNKKFKESWKNLMLTIEDGSGIFTNIWKSVVDFATQAINWIANLKTEFINLYNSAFPVRAFVEALGMSFKNMFAVVMLPLKELWNSFTGLGKVMGALVTGNFKDIPGIIKETLTKSKDIAVGTVTKIADNVKDAWNNTLHGKMELPIEGASPADIKAAQQQAEELAKQKAENAKAAAETTKAEKEAALKALEIGFEKEKLVLMQQYADKEELDKEFKARMLANELAFMKAKLALTSDEKSRLSLQQDIIDKETEYKKAIEDATIKLIEKKTATIETDNIQLESSKLTKIGTQKTEEATKSLADYTEKQKATAQTVSEVSGIISQGVYDMASGTEDALKNTGKVLLKFAIQMLKKQALIAVGSATVQSMAQPDSVVTFGASGLVRAAVLTGLIEAAAAGLEGVVDQFDKGRYPVRGATDGRLYSAGYVGKPRTGIYDKPSLGLFSERQPEGVIDGNTMQSLTWNYPHIWRGITTLASGGIPQFADGRYPASTSSSTAPVAERIDAQTDPTLLAVLQQNVALLQHLKENGVNTPPVQINAREIVKKNNDYENSIKSSNY